MAEVASWRAVNSDVLIHKSLITSLSVYHFGYPQVAVRSDIRTLLFKYERSTIHL